MAVVNPIFNSGETNKYTPIMYSNKVMLLFVEQTLLHEICNSDYEGDIKGQGDKVEVRVAPTYLTVNDYIAGNPDTTTDANTTATGIDYATAGAAARYLTIDQAKVVAFQFDEIEKLQSDIKLQSIYAAKAAESLAIDTSRNVLAVMALGAYDDSGDVWSATCSGNQGATAGKVTEGYDLGVYTDATPANNDAVSVDGTNALDYLVDLGIVLDEADVPIANRFVVLPAWFCGMLKKSDLKAANVTGDGTGVIRTGLIGEVNNFRVYQNNLLHTTTAGFVDGVDVTDVTAFHVLAGVTDATTFASQVQKTETVVAQDFFGELWRTLFVYGRKVIQPEALAMLYCTKG